MGAASAKPAPVGGMPTTKRAKYHLEVFAACFAALLLEISYTRVISFKLFYYFTYLVIGLALLGLGAGGVFVAISQRLRQASTDAIVGILLPVGGALVALGYLVVARMPINTLVIWRYDARTLTNGAILLVICLVLFASFLPVGIMLSTIFGREPEGINRLYFADLAGAALACAVAVPLAARIGPPGSIAIAASVLALSGIRAASRLGKGNAIVAVALASLFAIGAIAPSVVPDVRVDAGKEESTAPNRERVFSSWSSLFRVDVYEEGFLRTLAHDGLTGSVMFPWDGQDASLAKFNFDKEIAALPFAASERPPANELIIGAAGGRETMASLYFDAGHIDAVEINPVTYKLVTDTMADYVGHVADHPRVDYINADGRTILARSDDKYDLVWLPAPDSYSATNASTSSAFVLSESYLYTADAIEKSLDQLTPDGTLVAQFGEMFFNARPNRTLRYIMTAREALRKAGIENPDEHIMVSTSPLDRFPDLSTIVIKKSPLTEADVDRYTKTLANVKDSKLAYAPGVKTPTTVLTQAITGSDAEVDRVLSSYPFSVGAIDDNKPFFWHFSTFTDEITNATTPIRNRNVEVSVGERVLLLLLGIAIALSAAFLLLPFITIRKTWDQLPHRKPAALYFAAIGLGFMFFEIPLIQRFVLFLGYPTYSLTVTLSALLIFTGIGALVSSRMSARPKPLGALYAAIVAIALFYLYVVPPITDSLLNLPLAARIAIAFVFLAPLGLCLGMFMPLGLRSVNALGEAPRTYIAWAWALNGFASVTGSVLATIVGMTYGFRTVLMLAVILYLVAILALRRIPLTTETDSETAPAPDIGAPPSSVPAVS